MYLFTTCTTQLRCFDVPHAGSRDQTVDQKTCTHVQQHHARSSSSSLYSQKKRRDQSERKKKVFSDRYGTRTHNLGLRRATRYHCANRPALKIFQAAMKVRNIVMFITISKIPTQLKEHKCDLSYEAAGLAWVQQTKSMRCKVFVCDGASLTDLQKSAESEIEKHANQAIQISPRLSVKADMQHTTSPVVGGFEILSARKPNL